MSRSARLFLAASLVSAPAFISGSAEAQERPNFTGTWLMDTSRSESTAQAADASPREPVQLVIVHGPHSLQITRTVDGKPQTIDYTFEALETARPVATSGTRDADDVPVEKAMARWIDGKLATTTVYRVNGMATTKIETFTLSADGQEMQVLNELKMEHGYESNGKGPQGYSAATDVYKRVAAR